MFENHWNKYYIFMIDDESMTSSCEFSFQFADIGSIC